METKIDVCLDMDVLMNELKEALCVQETKADTIEDDLNIQTEKLLHLFAIKEYDLLLLFIKTLFAKHKLDLPDIFYQEYCSNELKESLCADIIANWLAIV